MDLEVRHLRVLLKLAAAGSISGAAQCLGVPQPALSRQLRRIEARLGKQLFTRSRAGLTTTAAGVAFLDHAERLVAAFDALVAADPAEPDAPGTLRLAAYCLPLESLIHHHRDELGVTAVHGRETGPQEAVDSVVGRTADLAAATLWPHMPDLDVPDHIRQITAVTEPMAVMIQRHHSLAALPVLDLGDLREEYWVARQGLDTTSAECAKAGFTAQITHHHTDHGYYLDLVGSGACVAFCSPTTHITDDIVIRPYYRASTIAWQLFHDPAHLPRHTVDRLACILAARRRRLAAAGKRPGWGGKRLP